jgi:predicted TIM-barrel fold metal-dependent hydrolase
MGQHGFSGSRRQALVTLGGLLGLSGCCALRQYPAQALASAGPVSQASRVFAPGRLQHSPLKPDFAIDVHAHFFNASDVNVAGYVEQAVAHTMKEPLRTFVRMMGPVLDDLAGYATSASEEYGELLRMASTLSILDASERGRQLDARIAARRDDIANVLYADMKKRGVDSKYIELQRQHARINGFDSAAVTEFSPAIIRKALEPTTALRTYGLEARARVLAGTSLDPDGVVQFMGYMLQDRWMNLRTYMNAYSTDNGAFGVDAAFGSLVDFDYWLDCPAHSARQDQMKVHSLISLMSGGYMLPLVSYNPWTDIKRSGESLQLVKDAITGYGFIGVKMYPPMGFYPYGNEANPICGTTLGRPDLQELDQKLEALFDWCISMGVPVMAHTDESMGRDDPSDEFGGPVGWSALLRKYAAKGSSPIINLGHFGGDSPKIDSNGVSTDSQWPAAFAALMITEPGKRIYGDFGYWTELRACTLREKDKCDQVLARIALAKNKFPDLNERIMYGTDWLMISKEPDWPSYPQDLAVGLEGTVDPGRFFYRNAIACFGLGRNGGQRQRVIDRFGEANLPSWLAAT